MPSPLLAPWPPPSAWSPPAWPPGWCPWLPLRSLKPGPAQRGPAGPAGRVWAQLGPLGAPEWGTEGQARLQASQGWLWRASKPEAEALPVPLIPGLDHADMVWRFGRVQGPAWVQDYVENTLDLLHAPHVHPYTHPMAWARRLGLRRPIRVRLEPTREGFRAEAWWPPLGQRRLFTQRAILPGAIGLTMLPDGPLTSEVWAFHEDEGRHEASLTFLVGRRTWWGGLAPPAQEDPGGWRLHQEDLKLLEGLARARALWGTWPEALVEADAYVQAYRQAMAHWRHHGHLELWSQGPALELELPG